jgi:SAM-dependent methyltransferase
MIEISNERAAKRGLSGVTFQQGRIEDETLDPDTFDVAWTRDSVVCVKAKDRLWKNVYHSLKPGGRLFATDFCRSKEGISNEFSEHALRCEYYLQDLDDYVSTLQAAGFRDVIAKDSTGLLIEFLHQERAKLDEKEPDFARKYGAAEFKFLRERWDKKIRFCEQGDLRWGKFTARK